jgi:zinc finger SWIM domain-containing protein 3
MYNRYAGLVRFSVRKYRTKRRKSDDSLSQKYFVCCGEGQRKNEESKMDIKRTGCDARVQFSISKENVWTVQKVVLDHNHYLASPNKTHLLRSQREIIEADRKLIRQARRSGMKPS